MNRKTLVMTGGGTAGHAMVAQAIIPTLVGRGWQIAYIGSTDGIERQMMEGQPHVDYYPISVGKLRRYPSLRNLTDPFRVLLGIWQAFKLLGRLSPDSIFSGGGFVAVPVVLAGWLRHIPTVIRETDYTMGLANRICLPFARKVCVTFYDTREEFDYTKGAYFGEIIRPELLHGSRTQALELTGLDGRLPTILVMGGSQGAASINESVRRALPYLSGDFNVLHLCGKGKVSQSLNIPNYRQYEFAGAELAHYYALADIVVTRCGSNAICEGMVLRKPMLMIPLPQKSSRGDQQQNARYAARNGSGIILPDECLSDFLLLRYITELYNKRAFYVGRTTGIDLGAVISQQIDCIENAG